MWSARLVDEKLTTRNRPSRYSYRIVNRQIQLLVLEQYPKAFDEHINALATFVVHAGNDVAPLRCHYELEASDLASLAFFLSNLEMAPTKRAKNAGIGLATFSGPP